MIAPPSPLSGDVSEQSSDGVVLDGVATGIIGSESTDGLAFGEAQSDSGCVVSFEIVAEPVVVLDR